MKSQVLAVVAAGFLLGVCDAQDAAKAGNRIQGTWQGLSVEDGGRKQAAEGLKWVITGDKIVWTAGDRVTKEFTYKLDTTKKPMWIDFERKGDDRPYLGIYEREGDSLKICFNEGQLEQRGKRATKFASEPNSPNDVLITLKREKP